jgi:repressor of nif and glnA expression
MSDTPKARTLWPLPGGSGTYLAGLRRILGMVEQTSDRETILDQLVAAYGLTSRKAARSYLQVLNTLGFVEVVGRSVYLTPEGRKELAKPNRARVRQALLGRVAGCTELLEALGKRPLRMAGAAEHLRAAGFRWSTQTQVRYRLRWLEEVGDVERHGNARPEYRLTSRRASR